MLPTLRVLVSILAVSVSISAQTYNVSYEKKTGYNGWATGWDTVHAVKNELVTVAVVPKLGGRVMQYDLGTNKSLFVNKPATVPTKGDDLIGGFRVLPSPQSDFEWPSPPNLDFNPYTCVIRSNSADSVVIYLESQIENSTDAKYAKHKGLQFKRLITLYKASTRVRVEMTMLNKGTQPLTHGLWDITQTVCASASNCWVYFQRNPSSALGGGKGYVHYASAPGGATQWKPDAADGKIMGVQFLGEVGKIGADCKAGWICFNDRATGYAYAKTFTYENGKPYPDSGASVQVYTYADYEMLEVEVLGPLVTLAVGDSTKLVENWFAARSNGPVLGVSAAGLITKKLAAQQTADSLTLTGTFGVFYSGRVKTQYCNSAGAVIATPDSAVVLPTDSLRVNKKFCVPTGAASIHLAAFSTAGELIGTLDSAAVPNPAAGGTCGITGIINGQRSTPQIARIRGMLTVDIPYSGTFTTETFTVSGKRIATFTGKAPYRHTMDVAACAANVLIVKIAGAGRVENRMVYMAGR